MAEDRHSEHEQEAPKEPQEKASPQTLTSSPEEDPDVKDGYRVTQPPLEE